MDALDPPVEGVSSMDALQDMLLAVDADGSGTLDFDELLQLVGRKSGISDKEEVRFFLASPVLPRLHLQRRPRR